VFLVDGIDVRLYGEANDSVCKSMSGGRVAIMPHPASPLDAERSAIIGNCALYGATGGRLFVRGLAGDRFAVRNSGAVAVVEGAGLHACGYMTRGTVVILGAVSDNVGSGMTGGVLYCLAQNQARLNEEYVAAAALSDADAAELRGLMEEHHERTASKTATRYLADPALLRRDFVKVLPVGQARKLRLAPDGMVA
jgi:glutamate synthase domain-containing protein 3